MPVPRTYNPGMAFPRLKGASFEYLSVPTRHGGGQ